MSAKQSSIAKVERHLEGIERYLGGIRKIPDESIQYYDAQGASARASAGMLSAVKEPKAIGSTQPRYCTRHTDPLQTKQRDSVHVAAASRVQANSERTDVSVPVYSCLGTTAALLRSPSSESLLSSSSSTIERSSPLSPCSSSPPLERYGVWRAALGSNTSSSMSAISLVSFSSMGDSPAGEIATRWVQWGKAAYYLLASHYEKCNAALMYAHEACRAEVKTVKRQKIRYATNVRKNIVYSTPWRTNLYDEQSLSTVSGSSDLSWGKPTKQDSSAEQPVRSSYKKAMQEDEEQSSVQKGNQQGWNLQEVQTNNETTWRPTITSVSTERSGNKPSAITSAAHGEKTSSTMNYSPSNQLRLSGNTIIQEEESRFAYQKEQQQAVVSLCNNMEHVHTRLVEEERRARRVLHCYAVTEEEAIVRGTMEREEDERHVVLMDAVDANARALRARLLRRLGDSLRALHLAEEDNRANIEDAAQYAVMGIADAMRRSAREATLREQRRRALQEEQTANFWGDIEHVHTRLVEEERRARRVLHCYAVTEEEAIVRGTMEREEDERHVVLMDAVDANARALRARLLRRLGDSLRALHLAEEDNRANIEDAAQYAAMGIADAMRRSAREATLREQRRRALQEEQTANFWGDIEHVHTRLVEEERRARRVLHCYAVTEEEAIVRGTMEREEDERHVVLMDAVDANARALRARLLRRLGDSLRALHLAEEDNRANIEDAAQYAAMGIADAMRRSAREATLREQRRRALQEEQTANFWGDIEHVHTRLVEEERRARRVLHCYAVTEEEAIVRGTMEKEEDERHVVLMDAVDANARALRARLLRPLGDSLRALHLAEEDNRANIEDAAQYAVMGIADAMRRSAREATLREQRRRALQEEQTANFWGDIEHVHTRLVEEERRARRVLHCYAVTEEEAIVRGTMEREEDERHVVLMDAVDANARALRARLLRRLGDSLRALHLAEEDNRANIEDAAQYAAMGIADAMRRSAREATLREQRRRALQEEQTANFWGDIEHVHTRLVEEERRARRVLHCYAVTEEEAIVRGTMEREEDERHVVLMDAVDANARALRARLLRRLGDSLRALHLAEEDNRANIEDAAQYAAMGIADAMRRSAREATLREQRRRALQEEQTANFWGDIEHVHTRLVEEERRARRVLHCYAVTEEEAIVRGTMEREEDERHVVLMDAVDANARALRARLLRRLGDSLRALHLAEEDNRANIEDAAQYAAMGIADAMRRSAREAFIQARRRVAAQEEEIAALLSDIEHSQSTLMDEERRARHWIQRQALLSQEIATRAATKYEKEARSSSGTNLISGDTLPTVVCEAQCLAGKLFSSDAEDPVPEEISVRPTPLVAKNLSSFRRPSRSYDGSAQHADKSVETSSRCLYDDATQTPSRADEEISLGRDAVVMDKWRLLYLSSESVQAEVPRFNKVTQSFMEPDSLPAGSLYDLSMATIVKDNAEEEEEQEQNDFFVSRSSSIPAALPRVSHRRRMHLSQPPRRRHESSPGNATQRTLSPHLEPLSFSLNYSSDEFRFFPIDGTVRDVLCMERRHRRHVERHEQLERNELRWDELNRFRTHIPWRGHAGRSPIGVPFHTSGEAPLHPLAGDAVNVLVDSPVDSAKPDKEEEEEKDKDDDKENARPVRRTPAVSWSVNMCNGPGRTPPHLRSRPWAPMLARSGSAGLRLCEYTAGKKKWGRCASGKSLHGGMSKKTGGAALLVRSTSPRTSDLQQQQTSTPDERRGSYAMQFQRLLVQQQRSGCALLPLHPPYCRATASFLEAAEWRYQKIYITQLFSMSVEERRDGIARKCADAVCDEVYRIIPPSGVHWSSHLCLREED